MQRIDITVGILSVPKLNFSLKGIYSTSGEAVVTGRQEVSVSESGLGVVWQGQLYPTLIFTPTSYDGDSFELEGVTIGVDFHWQRQENQSFRGALKIIAKDGLLTAINIIDIEDYLVSVISSEMRSTSSVNLLRAHAVISRSWAMSRIMGRKGCESGYRKPGEIIRWWGQEDHEGFDVCADDHCQRYQGLARISPTAAGAVEDTRGQLLTYHGELCDARFSKCCGGVFEEFEACWEDEHKPYLVARRDAVNPLDFPDLTDEQTARKWITSSPEAFCNTTDERVLTQVLNNYDREQTDFYRWRVEYTSEYLGDLIRRRLGEDLGEISDIIPVERGKSGRIIKLKIKGSKAEIIIGKELLIRRTLSESHLRSSAFVVDKSDTGFILTGAGWGHGVGLCQIGAAVMADRGYDYREILSRYYPGSEIQSHI